ncbi:MAG: arginine N-succinyltransferase [Phycisphaerales bacterium]|nr:arginine N-succinyltransferase [Phycisphaerales bacterium]
MFVVRPAHLQDVPALLRMARTVHSGNIPADPVALEARVRRSTASFLGREGDADGLYVLVLEDSTSGNVLGTSCLIAGKGGAERPRLGLRVRKREHYSSDLQTGQVQVTVQLVRDTSGPTEVGGLVLSPAWRGTGHRLGSLLSLARFALVGLRPERFSRRMIGEIMGDLTADGRTMLWDHLGRRFINLSYQEADRFSRTSCEFITSLFPEGEIYVSLLPAEARRLIGHVSPDAVPALRMLERLGFRHSDEVDPFDGGPYLEADRDEIPIVTATRRVELTGLLEGSVEGAEQLVSSPDGETFRCVRTQAVVAGDGVQISQAAATALKIEPGAEVGLSPASVPSG